MMKAIYYSWIALILFSVEAKAQIFNQNGTQKKYLLDQIAALQVYKDYLQKGYSITKNGTGTISSIKNGDLGLHTAYYDSLSTVSARVRNYPKVKAIITLQKQIVSGHEKAASKIAGSKLTATEKNSYNTIYKNILQQSAADLEELQLVITNGKLKMSDDERLLHIDRLYNSMLNSYGKTQQLNGQTLALAAQRERDGKDNKTLKSLYGL